VGIALFGRLFGKIWRMVIGREEKRRERVVGGGYSGQECRH